MTPVAAIDATPIIVAVVAGLLGGGGAALLKIVFTGKPEASSIAVSTVIKTNEDLRKELDRNQKTIDRQAAEIIALEEKVSGLRVDVEHLSASLEAARQR